MVLLRVRRSKVCKGSGPQPFKPATWVTLAQTLRVTLTGASPTQTLYRFVVDPAALPTPAIGDLLPFDKVVVMTNGVFVDVISPGAFAVYSAVNPKAP